MAWASQGSIPDGAMSFARLKNAQTGSAAHPVFHVLSTGVLCTGVRYHVPPSTAEVKIERSYTSISSYLTSECIQGQL